MGSFQVDTIGNETMRITPSMVLSDDTELSSESLTRKFGRLQRQPQPVIYELTGDPGLLHQYYQSRENMFIHVWGLQNFAGTKDEFDDHSDIMVARAGNHCIGGGRLTFTAPKDRKKLPMEKEGFRLTDALPQLHLGDESYVEISRMAILPEYQNSVVLLELSRHLLKCGVEKKARYVFTLAPAKLARNYHKAASLFGLEWQVLNDVKIPEREEDEAIKMVLSMLDLAPVYRTKVKKKKQATTKSLTAA